MPSDNSTLFDAGMDKANAIIYTHFENFLMKVCDESVVYAMSHHSGFWNFTGNTHTGYACGLYKEGKLVYISTSASKDKPPVRVKLGAGETAHLDPDYDGRTRSYTGVIETDRGYGKNYAVSFLQSHTPKVTKGLSICLTTGTEYSEYLEVVRHADVLTGTFMEIPRILFNNLKPLS